VEIEFTQVIFPNIKQTSIPTETMPMLSFGYPFRQFFLCSSSDGFRWTFAGMTEFPWIPLSTGEDDRWRDIDFRYRFAWMIQKDKTCRKQALNQKKTEGLKGGPDVHLLVSDPAPLYAFVPI